MPILEVENLSISFQRYKLGFKQEELKVISNLNISLEKGEILAVVGASGSGKTLLAHAILGILPSNANISGTIKYNGVELSDERQAELRGKEIALIPQSVTYLDPLMPVGKQVRTSIKQGDKVSIQRAVFDRYQLKEDVEKMYPFQLSGGMERRTLLATAMVSGAKVILADEPTPGIDSNAMKKVLQNLKELAESGCAVLLITHDIASVLKIADKIAVFYAGTVVEIAPVADFSGRGEALRHPYSKALWRALPENEFIPIPGSQPQPGVLPDGCVFEPRCEKATPECRQVQPEMRNVRNGMVRCIHAT